MRELQRYTVTVHRREIIKLLAQGDVIETCPVCSSKPVICYITRISVC